MRVDSDKADIVIEFVLVKQILLLLKTVFVKGEVVRKTSENPINIEVLPKDVTNPMFEQRESGRTHTPYEAEQSFYDCIRRGDVEELEKRVSYYVDNALVVGRMSNDSVRQTQYMAVSCITLATRYAIEGGLDQPVAYNLSDSYIQQIDKLNDSEAIMKYISQKAQELTLLVNQSSAQTKYVSYVRKAIKYISAHLHDRITVQEVADVCKVSADYISVLFKRDTGYSLSRYILRQKLEESKSLLGKYEYSAIGYYFGFCSQTYYISCFKNEFGMTPRQYAQKHGIDLRVQKG